MSEEVIGFGRFELIERLSAGGMGEIYLARQRGPYLFEKSFILKLMRSEFSEDPAELQRFAREARMAAQLHHSNLVQIHDFGSERGQYFIAMEYVDGLNLTRLMNALISSKHLFPYRLCAFIGAEVARALHYMHTRRNADGSRLCIVHRDVSPENILISKEGEIKLSDFGLVKYEGAEKLTRAGKVRGKLSYMAPERAVGEEADPSSDQFSLGMVLHELLVGRRYFPANMDRLEVQQSLLNQGILAPSCFRAEIPKELDLIVKRATSMESAERFHNLYEMEIALRKFLNKELRASSNSIHGAVTCDDELAQLVRLAALEDFSTTKNHEQQVTLHDVAPLMCRTFEPISDSTFKLRFEQHGSFQDPSLPSWQRLAVQCWQGFYRQVVRIRYRLVRFLLERLSLAARL